jgi:hypothetical protein
MADIVESLFGLNPYQIQQQQNQQLNVAADRYAQQDPLQRAAGSMYRAGGMFAGPMAESMGMVNPDIQQAQLKSAVMGQGGDLTTSAGLKAKAAQFAAMGDQETALKLLIAARKQEQEESKIALDVAKTNAELNKARAESSPFAKINPKDYTPASLKAYMTSRNPADLEAQTPEGKVSQIGRELIDAGYAEGSPEFITEMRRRISAKDEGTRNGSGTTVVMPGQKNAIDIPAFEAKVQSTIKPHLETVTAADMASATLNDSIKTGNYASFNAAKQQLARAFSDGTISRAEVLAAGADPSMVGAIVDTTSTLFTGTPTLDTQQKMLRTLQIARQVASSKGKTALDRMKKVGKMAEITDDQLNTLLNFPEFDEKQGLAVGQTRKLKSGKTVQRVN